MAGILIVEDDRELREMLKISLARRKYIVFEAEKGGMPSLILNLLLPILL